MTADPETPFIGQTPSSKPASSSARTPPPPSTRATDQPWTFAASLVWAALIALFTAQGRHAGTARD